MQQLRGWALLISWAVVGATVAVVWTLWRACTKPIRKFL